MADTAPPVQMSPSEVTAAAFELRRNSSLELGAYLDRVERQIDAINLQLRTGKLELILGPHQLLRSIKYRPDEQAALSVLASFGDAAPAVLCLGDFGAFAEAAFGPNCALLAAIRKHETGSPPASLPILHEAAQKLLEQGELPSAEPLQGTGKEHEKTKWWRPGWLAKNNAAAEAAAQAQQLARAADYDRLLVLRDEHHHYIDGFMDWVGETLEPSSAPPEAGVERLLRQYKDPQYVIRLAQADHADVLEVKLQPLRQLALPYHKIAALVDRQEIPEFARRLPALFDEDATPQEKLLRDLLLLDFGVASFAEMALNKVENRADQLLLLRTALALEPAFTLTGLSSRREIFERVLREVTAPVDPLGREALDLALEKLRRHPDETAYDIMGLKKGAPNPLARLLDSLGNGLLAVVGALLGVPPKKQGELCRRRDADGDGPAGRHTVTLRRQLGERTFEEVFDFAARSCLTQIRNGEGGSVVARGTQPFSAIEDKSRLREAFTAYARKGGTLSEAEAFSGLDMGASSPKPRNPSYGMRR